MVLAMSLSLPPRAGLTAAFPAARPAPARLKVRGRDDEGRDAVERFVQDVYARRHGAQVRHFAPWLVSLESGPENEPTILAAAGYRLGTEPLFLERYLDEPVQSLLAGADPQVARERIVEVGHLAASEAGQGRRLILLLGPHLARLGVQWVVGTLTQELRHLFERMGVDAVPLGVADPARLGEQAADWGTYYDHRPVVLAGHLPQALTRLGRLTRAQEPRA